MKIEHQLYLKEFTLDYGKGIISEKIAISPREDENYLIKAIKDYSTDIPIPSDVVIITKAQFKKVFKHLFKEIRQLNKED